MRSDEQRKQEFKEMLNSMDTETRTLPFIGSDTEFVSELAKRVWACKNPNTVIQLRNCITDMYMLGVIQIGEYVALNDNIDRYIQYQLTHGNRETF